MPQRITGKQAGSIGKPRPIFIYGKLLPVEAEFRKWGDDVIGPDGKPVKDANGRKLKVEGTGGVVSYAEWVRLPDNKKGQKWFISIDQKMFRPDFEKPTTRGVMVDFDEWTAIVLPGILDAMAGVEEPVQTFLDRADSESWYVEAELVYSGEYLGKAQNLPRLKRMTQSEDELKAWHAERFPHGEEEMTVPDDIVTSAKFIWNRMAKGDKDKFNTAVNDDPELSPYLKQLAANDYAIVKG